MRENNNEILESLSITIYLLFCRGGWASFEAGFYCTILDGLKLKDDPSASALNTGFSIQSPCPSCIVYYKCLEYCSPFMNWWHWPAVIDTGKATLMLFITL